MVQGDVLVHVADGHVERTPRPAAEVVAAGSVDGRSGAVRRIPRSARVQADHQLGQLVHQLQPGDTTSSVITVETPLRDIGDCRWCWDLVSSLAFIPLTLALINVG